MKEESLQHLIETFANERERLLDELKDVRNAYLGERRSKAWHEHGILPRKDGQYEAVLKSTSADVDDELAHPFFKDGEWTSKYPGYEIAWWREIPDWRDRK